MDNLNKNASEEAQSPAFLVGAVSGSVSFPKGRPKCCGSEMYPAGGTVGMMDENSVQYWRCSICNNEFTDLAS